MTTQPKPIPARRRVDPLCGASDIAVAVVLGSAGGMGKSTIANALASFFEAAEIAVQTIRVETGVRRDEFPPQDIVIDLDGASEAAIGFGGEAAIFEPAWPACERALAGRGVALFDAGANAQRAFLDMAALTGLSERVVAASRESVVIIVATPDAEAGRQALALLRDAAERMPQARILLAINYSSANERPGVDTPQARAFNAQIQSCRAVSKLIVPFARAQALTAFAAGHMSMLHVLRASEAELMQLTGGGRLATAAAQAHFGAWWAAVTRQLEQLFPVDAR